MNVTLAEAPIGILAPAQQRVQRRIRAIRESSSTAVIIPSECLMLLFAALNTE